MRFMKKKLSNSIRKYIRKEKARIRREVLGTEEQKKLIDEIYQRFTPLEIFDSKNNNETDNA
jgi:hypothetical protein